MRTIALSRSILVFWEDLTYLEAGLLATDETQALAPAITAALDEFSDVMKIDLDTRRAVLQASARAVVADALIDQGLRGLFSATLHLVGQDRSQKEFTSLFSTHIGAIVKHALKRQVEVADEILGKLALSIYADTFRNEHTGLLKPLIEKGREVLAQQRAATLARAEGRISIEEWKQEVNAVRTSVYGQLLTMAAKTGRKKDWVEAFFLKTGTGEAAGEEGGAEPPIDGGDKGEGAPTG